ncbi:MAG: sulfotransferase [Yoonia sp.]|uniref:sulfotransferase n=1 Tax=Yoonia sp. TaxID=2212373 RepID=UPI003EF91B57
MIIDFNSTAFMAPEFYILGAVKAEESPVWSWLKSHPDVFLPDVKEPDSGAFGSNLATPEQDPFALEDSAEIATTRSDYDALYSEFLDQADDAPLPFYLASPSVAAKLAAVRPDARLIITLRRSEKSPQETWLAETRKALAGTRSAHKYAEPDAHDVLIAQYQNAFPEDQILILDYDRLQADPEACWTEICAHLELAEYPAQSKQTVTAPQQLTNVPSQPASATRITHAGVMQRMLKSVLQGFAPKRMRRVLEGHQMSHAAMDQALRNRPIMRQVPVRSRSGRLTGRGFAHG